MLVEALAEHDSLWIGDQAPSGIHQSSNAQALTHLGGECGMLIYNAYSGFDPDAFGALSGLLRGGGLLLLLSPPLDEWAKFADPQAERVSVAGYSQSRQSSHFLARISRILKLDSRVIRCTPEQIHPWNTPQIVVRQMPVPANKNCRTQDQVKAVEAIIHVAKGHRKRPLILISDRGRGKSSALGIAAAQLIHEGCQRILVTAPRQSAVIPLFEQAAKGLACEYSKQMKIDKGSSVILYAAPDQLIGEPQSADLLLVDEAAAIPTPLLHRLLAHYPRVVFSTTVHGYEGTGLGFNHRFKAHLNEQMPQWREVILKEAIRWASDDPLEKLIFSLLALDAEPANDKEVKKLNTEKISLEFPTQQQLLEQERDLNQLFGLLVLAHYRTTPLDLRHLLDGPNLQIVILRQEEKILAVALLASEGEFSSEMAKQIWAGRRRPRGHLLAQSLSAHLGLQSAATLKGLRIMRIAVHPVLQNRGLGQRLLHAIESHASNQGYDYLGVSFGATPELIRFWRQNRLLAVRLGLRASASSSHQSVIFLRSLSQAGEELLRQARKQFAKQLPALLSDPLHNLSAELAFHLLDEINHPSTESLERQEWLDLIAFAFALRGYDLTLNPIERLSLAALSDRQVEKIDGILLIKRVLQKQPWKCCATALGLTGRKAVEARLRRIIGKLILHYADEETLDILTALK
jgi:tRNA(Met) cytidine acetyltransferase